MDLEEFRSQLIELRGEAIDRSDFKAAVLLSHLVAAIADGCFTQTRPYLPAP